MTRWKRKLFPNEDIPIPAPSAIGYSILYWKTLAFLTNRSMPFQIFLVESNDNWHLHCERKLLRASADIKWPRQGSISLLLAALQILWQYNTIQCFGCFITSYMKFHAQTVIWPHHWQLAWHLYTLFSFTWSNNKHELQEILKEI